MTFQEKAKRVNCFVLDVDGVLTDGKLICAPDGAIWRNMNAKDGYALQSLMRNGFKLAIITSGKDHGVLEKLKAFGVELIYENVWEKTKQLNDFADEKNVDLERTVFIGDDIPDHGPMMACGVRCCPADAVPEIRAISDYVSTMKGGEGCVRDIIEIILRYQNKWFKPQ